MFRLNLAARLATTTLVCAGLTLGSVGVAHADPTPEAHSSRDSLPISGPLGTDAADLEQAFLLINSIPDEVLQAGDAAVRKWALANDVGSPTGRASILGCAGASALVIASTAFPAAKILKIKKLINSLGGVTQAVRVFWGASFSYEKIRALGGAAAALGAELLGITQIRQQCFK